MSGTGKLQTKFHFDPFFLYSLQLVTLIHCCYVFVIAEKEAFLVESRFVVAESKTESAMVAANEVLKMERHNIRTMIIPVLFSGIFIVVTPHLIVVPG